MKAILRLLILLTVLFGVSGCNRQFLRPFEPTANPETKPAPQAVPTFTPKSLPSGNAIQFEYEVIELGESNPFRALGYDFNEALNVKIERPDGTEVEYSANADAYGVLEGTISVATDRPAGVYTVIITGQSSGHETTGWFTVMKDMKTITGKIVDKDDEKKTIRVRSEKGQEETVKITDDTSIEDEDGNAIDFSDLNESDKVKVEYDPVSGEAIKIKKLR